MNKKNYLSRVVTYSDDIYMNDHNIYCRELLAIEEFNKNDYMRKICKMTQPKNIRILKDGRYLDQMFFCHILDHQRRDPS